MSKFEEFLQEIHSLPIDIRRCLVLMRQLDFKKEQLQNTNNRITKGYFASLSKKKNEKEQQTEQKKVIDQIRANYDEIERLSQEKLDLARKVFLYVEQNLSKLNGKMSNIQDKMKKDGYDINSYGKYQVTNNNKGRKQGEDDYEMTGMYRQDYNSQEEEKQSPKRNHKQGVHSKNQIMDQFDDEEIEPVSYEQNQELLRAFGGQIMGSQLQSSTSRQQSNQQKASSVYREPTYCFCNNVSYGDMIACDNKNCPYEWFHFPCVGLTTKPEGKYFCLKCQQSLQSIKKESASKQGGINGLLSANQIDFKDSNLTIGSQSGLGSVSGGNKRQGNNPSNTGDGRVMRSNKNSPAGGVKPMSKGQQISQKSNFVSQRPRRIRHQQQ
ncbi:chromatin remodeling contains zinc finger [Stylonychia lemnae]|uniref:Inhibitor of growth protein n=1 Tax=Stylonychia lemnae TaxID=5949 RepID=A0A078AFN3_STYLE|nr:chromatin remodeling contains zinc finger [Stylonychia lemnae]|eukprot:CDW80641.1 chromatin remodeling contains zinc finger [Stylonychia lemnae]